MSTMLPLLIELAPGVTREFLQSKTGVTLI